MSLSQTNQSHYLYQPSQALAGVVAGLFAISFFIALYQIIRKRSWVWFVFLFGIAMEVIGFSCRAVSAGNVDERRPFVAQFTLVILAPVMMAGVIYVVFSRIVFWVVPPEARTFSLIWVPPRFITVIFVSFDVVSLLLQLGAAVLISGTEPTDSDAQSKLNTGKTLGIAGIAIQLFGFGIFSVAAARFHFTSRKIDAEYARKNQDRYDITKSWSTLLWVVNTSCLLILIRSIYRMIQFAQGPTGPTQRHEWYEYVFDALPILLVCIIYNIWFPGNFLKHLGFRLPKEARERPSDPERHCSPEDFITSQLKM